MDDDLVAGLPVRDARADLPDDAGGIRAADVVAVLGVVAVAEDGDRLAERCPDVVEVDAGGHDADDHLERCGLRDLDLLDLECVLGLAFPLLADDPCGHRLRQRAGLHVEIRDFRYVNCHVRSTPSSVRKCRGSVSARNLPFAVRNPSEGATTFENPLWKPRRNHNLQSATSPTGPCARSATGSSSRASNSPMSARRRVVRDRSSPASRRARRCARRSRSALASSTPRRRRPTSTTCARSSSGMRGDLRERLDDTLERRQPGACRAPRRDLRRLARRLGADRTSRRCSRLSSRRTGTRSPACSRAEDGANPLDRLQGGLVRGVQGRCADAAAGRGCARTASGSRRLAARGCRAASSARTPTSASLRRRKRGPARASPSRRRPRGHRGDRDAPRRRAHPTPATTAAEGGGKKGDTVVEIGAAVGPTLRPDRLRGKNKQLSKNDAWTELQRVHGASATPLRGPGRGRRRQGAVRSRAAPRVPGQQDDRRPSTGRIRTLALAAGLPLGGSARPRGPRAAT